MGYDFAALFHCKLPGETLRSLACNLAADSWPELVGACDCWNESGFFEINEEEAIWIHRDSNERLSTAPSIPDLKYSFQTKELFFFTFGKDAICLNYVLRWRVFLTDPKWQNLMMDLCNQLAARFKAREWLVCPDESQIIDNFLNGMSFSTALERQTEPKVNSVSEMYKQLENSGNWDTSGYYLTKSN